MTHRRLIPFAFLFVAIQPGCRQAPTTEIPRPDTAAAEPQVRAKIESTRAALESDRTRADRWGRYAMVLSAHGYIDAAEPAFREAARRDSRDFRWPYYLAVALAAARPEAAAAAFETAVNLNPDYAAARVRYARLLHKLGRTADAERHFRAAIAMDETCAPAHQGLGELALARNALDEAIGALESALRLQPQNGPAANTLSTAYLRQGNAASAEKAADLARAAGSAPPPLVDPVYFELEREAVNLESYLSRGESLSRSGRLVEAEAELRQALKLKADHAAARASLARVLGMAGAFDAALAELQQALAAKADLPGGSALLAELCFQLNRLDDAEKANDTALRETPDDISCLRRRGDIFFRRGRLDDAARAYESLLERQSGNENAAIVLIGVLIDLGRYEDASARLSSLTSGESGSAAAWNMTGLLEMKRGRIDAAAAAFRNAVTRQPTLAVAQRGLARCLARQGRAPEAVFVLRDAVRADPSNWVLANELAWILATTEDDNARNGDEALRLAQSVLSDPTHKQPATLDTLAASYAAVGRFDEALQTISEAVSMAKARNHTPADIAEYESRIDLYKSKKPLRAKPIETLPV